MKKFIIAFSAILLFISCKNENEKAPADKITRLNRDLATNERSIVNNDRKEDLPTGDTVALPLQKQQENSNRDQNPVPKIDWDKKIIKNANLNIEVKDYNVYNTTLRNKVKQFGGYIAQEEQNQSEYKIENTLTIKVPVDQFDDAVNSITSNVKQLIEKKIGSQDVTTEVIDTKSRLEAKKQVRLRYLDLLKQAKNMQEILNVQSEINGIQEEIESASGRIEYLNHSSSFSTINLTFYQILNATVADPTKPSFSAKFSSAFRDGWVWIQEVFIILVSLWPLLMVVAGVFLIYRRTRKTKIKAA